MSNIAVASNRSTSTIVDNGAEFGGRLLLAIIFLISGLGKLGAYSGTAAYMASQGVPAALLPFVIATEVLGAVAIIAGWQTRIAALALAGFTLVAAFIFHNNFADQVQAIMFLKNVAITGGFLLLAVHGAGAWSVDRWRE